MFPSDIDEAFSHDEKKLLDEMTTDSVMVGNADEKAILTAASQIYSQHVTEEEVSFAPQIDSYEEFMQLAPDELGPATQKIVLQADRYTALKYLWWRFAHRAEYYDKWYFLLYVEALEIYLLDVIAHEIPRKLKTLIDKYPQLAPVFDGNPQMGYAFHQYTLLRSTAFLHQYLLEQIDIEEYLSDASTLDDGSEAETVGFARVINLAVKDGFISRRMRRLLHFIREVRNQSAHNIWLDRNYSIEILEHGSDCALYILNQLLASQFRDHVGYDFTRDTYAEELEQRITQEFEWWYYERKQTWQPSDKPDGQTL